MSRTGVLVAAASGMAASAAMQTLLSNATPRIVAELEAPQWYGFVGGSYLAASTLTLPVLAQWADRLGPRRLFALGHLTFTTGALAVALAPTMGWLLAARTLQGLGAGAITPAAIAAIGLVFRDRERTRALAWLALAQVVATGLGAPLGGWFTDGPGWRVGMVAAVPLSLVSLALARNLPTLPPPAGWWRFDARAQWRLWAAARLGGQALLACLIGAVTVGVTTYAPLLFQDRHQLSPTATGWLLLPMLVAAGCGTALAGKLASRPWLRPLAWGLLGLGLGLALAPTTWLVALALAVAGLGMGAILPLPLLDAQDAVARDQLAQASGLIQFGRGVGAALGVPLLSAWLAAGAFGLTGLFLTLTATALAGLLLTRKAAS
ncbi:MAG: MFS transporter [Propionibacteriaceae bacterium]|nr:MFS transporter [Propionibacteriaceae bacterium]